MLRLDERKRFSTPLLKSLMLSIFSAVYYNIMFCFCFPQRSCSCREKTPYRHFKKTRTFFMGCGRLTVHFAQGFNSETLSTAVAIRQISSLVLAEQNRECFALSFVKRGRAFIQDDHKHRLSYVNEWIHMTIIINLMASLLFSKTCCPLHVCILTALSEGALPPNSCLLGSTPKLWLKGTYQLEQLSIFH